MYRFALRALPALALILLIAAPAQAAPDARTGSALSRPSVTIVKKALIKKFAIDEQYGAWKNTVKFKSLKLMPTRRAVPARDFIEPGKHVTPVASAFLVTQRDTKNGYCYVWSYSWTGIFWRGDFGWEFKNRDVKYKRIADTC